MDSRPMRILVEELQDNVVGQALLLGRLLATIESKETGNYISLQLTCKREGPPRRQGDKRSWERCTFAECDRVFIDVPRRDEAGDVRSGKPVGTWSLVGWQPGYIVTPYGQDEFDPKRIWAAIKVLEVAASRASIDTDTYRIQLGTTCLICGRELTQKDSITRGIGSTCWRNVTDYEPPESAGHHYRDEAKPIERAAGEAIAARRESRDPRLPTDLQMTMLTPGEGAQSALTHVGAGEERPRSAAGPGRDAYLDAKDRRREEALEADTFEPPTDDAPDEEMF